MDKVLVTSDLILNLPSILQKQFFYLFCSHQPKVSNSLPSCNIYFIFHKDPQDLIYRSKLQNKELKTLKEYM